MPSDIDRRSRPPPLITVSGAVVSYIHTIFGFLAFGSALAMGLSLHYKKVVKNGVAGWPDEFWPSVSATIGDWYPERNLFQIGIALMSGPRFMLVMLSSLLVSLSNPRSYHSRILLVVGALRTIACGGWVYVTSSDDHDVHDIAMALYLILTPPWMYITSGSLATQPNKEQLSNASRSDALADRAKKMRRWASGLFFGMMPFMVHFFYRHKVLEIPGAYTQYAFFEWGLIIFDLLFDCASMWDLSRLEIHIVEARSPAGPMGSAGDGGSSLWGGAWALGGTYKAVSTGAWSTIPPEPPSTSNMTREPKTGLASSVKDHSMDDGEPPLARDAVAYLSECYIALCWWTTLTALHPQIFFFSVYNMGVGGHEVLLVIQVLGLAATLLPFVRRTLIDESRPDSPFVGSIDTRIVAILYALSLTGMCVWKVDDQLVRLLGTALGALSFAILSALEWSHAWETSQVERKATAWIVGLLFSSLAKYANHSNNPFWPFLNGTNGGLNALGLILAAAAASERVTTHAASKSRPLPMLARSRHSLASAWAASLSLGALIFAFHVHLSDSGSLIAWTWTGFPIEGPTAILNGRHFLSVSAVSTLISLVVPSMATNPLFHILGYASTYVVLRYEAWRGFAGALGVAFFLPPLAVPILRLAGRHHPLKIMLGAWLVADLLAFLQVLTVAYAFLPGAMVMREHTGAMMVVQLTFLTIGLLFSRKEGLVDPAARASPARIKRLAYLTVPLLVALSLAARMVPSARSVPARAITPYHSSEDRVVTAGIWTVHFSLDQAMWDSTRRISSLVRDMELDIVGLLETDLHRTVFGNRDMSQFLAEDLGMYADLGPGPDKHTWGAILLSKFPIINSTHHLLPSPHGELAPAIHAVLDIWGVHTHVVVSHNGQEEDPLDRELQTTELARILREAYPHPAIFLGYVVTKPHAPRPNPYDILFNDGKIQDVDPSDWNRWCEYIGFRALERIGYVRVSRYTVSDTELQTVKLLVPPVGQAVDPDRDVRPVEIDNSTVPASWQYPHKFIDPPAMVYNKHKYSPHYYPKYFAPHAPPT